VYWQNREYLGLGAGAHSFLNGVRFSTVLLPNRYVELVDASVEAMRDGRGAMQHVIGAETITRDLSIADTLILGLRLNEGIDLKEFRARYGHTVDDVHGALVAEFESYGILERAPSHLRLTRRGRLLSNELFQRLLPEASPAPA
jgi:oxygen-independent coproporphyrinogen-3 oxidase